MEEDIGGTSTGRVLLIAVAVTALLALAAWQFGLFNAGQERTVTYRADVADESGGELIVTDPRESGVAVDLPETAMTPVPAEASPATVAETASPAATTAATPAE